MQFRRTASLLAAGLLSVALAGPVLAAEPLEVVVGPIDTDVSGNDANVRFLHAAPGVPAVTVTILRGNNPANIEAEWDAVAYGDLTTYDPVNSTPAPSSFSICLASDPTDCPVDSSYDFSASSAWTIIAYLDENGDLALLILDDGTAATDGDAAVRAIHLSPDAPAVDVINDDDDSNLIDALALGDVSDWLYGPAGSLDVRICADADNTVCPLDPGALTLEQDVAYDVFVIGEMPVVEPTSAPTTPPTDLVGTESTGGTGIAPVLAVLAAAAALMLALTRRAPARKR